MNYLPVFASTAALPPAGFADERAWTGDMKAAIRDSHQLLAAVGLAATIPQVSTGGAPSGLDEGLAAEVLARPKFPVFVPPALLARISRGNANDPILRQVLPLADEEDAERQAEFGIDPLGEFPDLAAPDSMATEPKPGDRKWIQKYHGRALLITTGACAINCRYCFRRHFPYPSAPQQRTRWQPWLEPIAADPTIREVILSGGDPLVLHDESLCRLLDGLREISHVKWLRIHSRMPVVIPSRITNSFLALFEGFAAKTMVIHVNHAQELDDEVAQAMLRLRHRGFQLLNQSVLLRGVNDSVSALMDLSCRLVELGVVPYYLHQLDRVRGAAHFEVSIERGLQLVAELRQKLPGHAIPRYVQENPGQPSKTILA
ncbi:MAG: KamA family radical SAM protein [Planctomycetaceae bacterium]|nr:KamA family radical SAM protein [Planctomycetaceae bacterium]